jgi:hypothetical protein
MPGAVAGRHCSTAPISGVSFTLLKLQLGMQGDAVGLGYPAEIDEGVIKVVKENKPLFDLFGSHGKEAYGGALKADGS